MTQKQSYMSVTEVLYHGEKTFFYTQESAKRGTDVHNICEESCQRICGLTRERNISRSDIIHQTKQYVYESNDLKDEQPETNYMNSFFRWAEITNPVPHLSEKRLFYDKKKITGKPDFVGYMNGQPGIGVIDWKTSAAFNPLWRCQICMYAFLLKTNGIPINWGASVRLRRDGKTALFNLIFSGEQRRQLMYVNNVRYFFNKYKNIRS